MVEASQDPRDMFITRQEAADIALAAAKEASRQTLNETFLMLGVNLASFDDMQKFRDDLEWARNRRVLAEQTGKRLWTAIVTVTASGMTIALWEYIRTLFGKHP